MRIVLTGASSGIGRHLARGMIDSHEVWGIARSDSSLSILKEQLGDDFAWSSTDVSCWSSVESVACEVARNWGSVDALVCCAGLVLPIGPAVETDPQEWSKTVRVNLDGTYYTIRAFYDLLRVTTSRSKVICFSGGGATGPRANFTAYAAAKAGVVRLVETLAEEWIDESIDVNAVAPGAISTQMTQAVIDAGPERAGESEYSRAVDQKSSDSEGLNQVFSLVDYLLSSESDGISGRLISAPWDPWREMTRHRTELMRSDIYTLRRIVPIDRGIEW